MRYYYWNFDTILDQFPDCGTLGMVALEAIASGRPVITHVSSAFDEYGDFPLKDVQDVRGVLNALDKPSIELWRREYDYLLRNHDPRIVSQRVVRIYEELNP